MRNEHKELPTFASLAELEEFFETHDMGDYWESMPEAHFEVDITKRTRLMPIDAELAYKLAQIAKHRETTVEALINSWLREKVGQVG